MKSESRKNSRLKKLSNRLFKSKRWEKPQLKLQVTTLWDYPSQHYGNVEQGSKRYIGATPSYIIWNLLKRYTQEGDLVVDPMCGSGTTIDVCHDLSRSARGFDLVPFRADIEQGDARHLPIKSSTVDFVFIDPPYSTHVEYSDHKKCIGKLSAEGGEYYVEMKKVITEIARILRAGRYMALYVSDSFVKGKSFQPLGFHLFSILCEFFDPIDIVSVVRHNAKLNKGNFRKAAEEGNFFLRGFNYLFIMKKKSAFDQRSTKSNSF